MKKGKVKYFYKTRDFGFIKKDEDNEDIYFMGADVKDKQGLQPGDVVSFKEEKHGNRLKAIEVTKIQ